MFKAADTSISWLIEHWLRSAASCKGKGKRSCSHVGTLAGKRLTSLAKQAKTTFLHGPTVWTSLIVGIEPATFRSESTALTTAPQDPTHKLCLHGNSKWLAMNMKVDGEETDKRLVKEWAF